MNGAHHCISLYRFVLRVVFGVCPVCFYGQASPPSAMPLPQYKRGTATSLSMQSRLQTDRTAASQWWAKSNTDSI